MLYVSTRNTKDTYTAYRALVEITAPDGGFYVPFRLPEFTQAEMVAFKTQSCSETVAQILNLFFGLHLTGLDVEFKIGRNPFKTETMQHKLTVAECWRNPDASYRYLLTCLYDLMTDGNCMGNLPVGWSCIGTKIALLFGLYTVTEDIPRTLDIAVTAGDFSDLTAIAYAKKMGLPINLIVCTCGENSAFWDLVNRGEFSANTNEFVADRPNYLECYLYHCFGADSVSQYLAVTEKKGIFYIDELQQEQLRAAVFAAVVSGSRVDTVASNMLRTTGYRLDTDSALAFGGLQDYRSSTGINNHTLILSKKRPVSAKE